ncbi:16S rRNA (cytidine(1402)-2'-O)-methyltransferase [Benzoatithermus flavus]|uniref:Ribosomal RNA small subunit methyltransferase I n=1 Tax=Benzoatithermus flavus TaxID=3108223 RepID=A0ABU8XLV5_9PROT
MRRERTRHLTGSAGRGSPQPAAAPEGGAATEGAGRESQLAPGLYLVATPIGNLGDITRRAETVLTLADLVVCEDRRVTSRLLRHLGLSRPLGLYHEHNAEAARPELLARLEAGGSVALVSDAGTPAVSDPGYKLVREAVRRGIRVHPIPGPSAALAALVASGLPTDRFLFQGFLPPRSSARRRVLEELATVRATLLLFEAPHRLAETLADAAAVLGDRPAVIARELTKLHEELRPGTLGSLAAAYATAGTPKGEIVIVVAPPEAPAVVEDDAAVDRLLAAALRTKRPRLAAGEVAAATGRSANELYKRALALSARERS